MFGKTLRELRESRRLKQRELAKAIYISPSAISQYENGRTRPSRDNLETIAKYFNVSTDYLLGTSPNADIEKQMNQQYYGDITAADLFKKCLTLHDEQRKTLLAVVDALQLLDDKLKD